MAGRYVPPALRAKMAAASDSTAPGSSANPQTGDADQLWSLEEIHAYYWPPEQAAEAEISGELAAVSLTGEENQPPTSSAHLDATTVSRTFESPMTSGGAPTSSEDTTAGAQDGLEPVLATRRRRSSLQTQSTLNNSASRPQQLVYIMLFPGANPKWDSEGKIFVKSNLHLLPRPDMANVPPESTSVSHPPIAVYAQPTHASTHKPSTAFIGFYKLSSLMFLEPGSSALIEMLEEKWAPQQNPRTGRHFREKIRSPEQWKESLRHEWCVLMLEKLPEVEWPEKPGIKELPGRDAIVQRTNNRLHDTTPRGGRAVKEMDWRVRRDEGDEPRPFGRKKSNGAK